MKSHIHFFAIDGTERQSKFSAQKQKSQNQKKETILGRPKKLLIVFFLAISTSTEKFESVFLS
jgi:hypothetical protein